MLEFLIFSLLAIYTPTWLTLTFNFPSKITVFCLQIRLRGKYVHDTHSLHKCSMSMQSPTNLTASKYS